MAVEVKRKGNESSESLLRRFQDKIKRSRTLNAVKRNFFHHKKISKTQAKTDALVRKYNRAKREFMIKTGKLPEPSATRGGFKRR